MTEFENQKVKEIGFLCHWPHFLMYSWFSHFLSPKTNRIFLACNIFGKMQYPLSFFVGLSIKNQLVPKRNQNLPRVAMCPIPLTFFTAYHERPCRQQPWKRTLAGPLCGCGVLHFIYNVAVSVMFRASFWSGKRHKLTTKNSAPKARFKEPISQFFWSVFPLFEPSTCENDSMIQRF